MKHRLDFVTQVALSVASFVVVGAAVRLDPHMNARWITAAASVAVLVSLVYISSYLWLVSIHLQQLCMMLSGDEYVDPELRGTLGRLNNIIQELQE